MKIIRNIFFLIFIGTALNSPAQPEGYRLLSGEEKSRVENKLLLASKEINTLRCNFLQEKSSVLLSEKSSSKGILLYETPAFLRWEYTEPAGFALILNKDDMYLKSDRETIVNPNRMFKQLGDLIISTINGDGLKDSRNFKVEYFEHETDKNSLWVKLIPVPKRMKDIYNSIQIKVGTDHYLASEIIMEEKSGDIMKITLSHKEINIDIPKSQFTAD